MHFQVLKPILNERTHSQLSDTSINTRIGYSEQKLWSKSCWNPNLPSRDGEASQAWCPPPGVSWRPPWTFKMQILCFSTVGGLSDLRFRFRKNPWSQNSTYYNYSMIKIENSNYITDWHQQNHSIPYISSCNHGLTTLLNYNINFIIFNHRFLSFST